VWDLSAWDGIEIDIGRSDGKVYTFILKDESPAEQREGGREKAGVNWEVELHTSSSVGEEAGEEEGDRRWGRRGGGQTFFVAWPEFKATYRGKPKSDAVGLKTSSVRRVGFMMRSYFGRQEGDFSVELRSVGARKAPKARQHSKIRGSGEEGWIEWFRGPCTVS